MGGGVSYLAVPCAVHMVILPNEIIPYRVCLSFVFRLVAIDEVKAARRISLNTFISLRDSKPECCSSKKQKTIAANKCCILQEKYS